MVLDAIVLVLVERGSVFSHNGSIHGGALEAAYDRVGGSSLGWYENGIVYIPETIFGSFHIDCRYRHVGVVHICHFTSAGMWFSFLTPFLECRAVVSGIAVGGYDCARGVRGVENKEVHYVLVIVNDFNNTRANGFEGFLYVGVIFVIGRDGDRFRKCAVVPKDVLDIGGTAVGTGITLKGVAVEYSEFNCFPYNPWYGLSVYSVVCRCDVDFGYKYFGGDMELVYV